MIAPFSDVGNITYSLCLGVSVNLCAIFISMHIHTHRCTHVQASVSLNKFVLVRKTSKLYCKIHKQHLAAGNSTRAVELKRKYNKEGLQSTRKLISAERSPKSTLFQLTWGFNNNLKEIVLIFFPHMKDFTLEALIIQVL